MRDAAARVDDHVAARQEAIRHANRLIERPARVVAQVEQQLLHALALQLLQRASEVAVGDFGEVAQPDVAGAIVDHERALQRGDVHLVALDRQIDERLEALALDRDVDRRALRTFERLTAFSLVQPFASSPSIFAMMSPRRRPLLEGRRALEHVADEDVAIERLNADAEAVVAAFLALAHLGVAARIEEARMRIEGLQHPVDGAVDQSIGFDFAHVLRFDRGEGRREDAVPSFDLVLGGEQAGPEDGAHHPGQHHRQQQRRDYATCRHVSHRTKQPSLLQ